MINRKKLFETHEKTYEIKGNLPLENLKKLEPSEASGCMTPAFSTDKQQPDSTLADTSGAITSSVLEVSRRKKRA